MCIIVSKEKGVSMPSWKILKTCFINNPDGAGYMYHNGTDVTLVKGLMTYTSFEKSVKETLERINEKETPMVFHFRIGTHGGNVQANTHPFPITESVHALKKLKMNVNLAVVHNGIIPITVADKNISDTMEYIMTTMYPLKKMNSRFYRNKYAKKLMYNTTNSKLTFLDKDGNVEYVGKFIDVDGIKYSNSSYEPYIYYYKKDYNDDYKYGIGTDGQIVPMEWLDSNTSYLVMNNDGYILSSDGYLLDEDYNLYEYDFQTDVAVPVTGQVYDWDAKKYRINENDMEYVEVAHGWYYDATYKEYTVK